MTNINLSKHHRAVYEQLASFSEAAETAAATAGLDPKLVELVKIRVSQINGCAFCLRMHTRDAIAAGESTDRLAVVAAWWESQYFSPAEEAAFIIAEDVTRLPVPERTIDAAALTPEQVSAISWLAVVMNAWNRVAIRSHYPVGP